MRQISQIFLKIWNVFLFVCFWLTSGKNIFLFLSGAWYSWKLACSNTFQGDYHFIHVTLFTVICVLHFVFVHLYMLHFTFIISVVFCTAVVLLLVSQFGFSNGWLLQRVDKKFAGPDAGCARAGERQEGAGAAGSPEGHHSWQVGAPGSYIDGVSWWHEIHMHALSFPGTCMCVC